MEDIVEKTIVFQIKRCWKYKNRMFINITFIIVRVTALESRKESYMRWVEQETTYLFIRTGTRFLVPVHSLCICPSILDHNIYYINIIVNITMWKYPFQELYNKLENAVIFKETLSSVIIYLLAPPTPLPDFINL